jgi:hypothetical protein
VSTSSVVFGIIIPGTVFALSYYLTHLLYRHFAGKQDE